jgi:hypothetical protein
MHNSYPHHNQLQEEWCVVNFPYGYYYWRIQGRKKRHNPFGD